MQTAIILPRRLQLLSARWRGVGIILLGPSAGTITDWLYNADKLPAPPPHLLARFGRAERGLQQRFVKNYLINGRLFKFKIFLY